MLLPGPRHRSNYDLLIVALGYEPRSVKIADEFAGCSESKWALDFDTPDLFSFNCNQKHLRALGFESIEVALLDIYQRLFDFLSMSGSSCTHIGIDVSSFSRSLLADMLLALDALSSNYDLQVDCWYSPAKFEAAHQPSSAIDSAGLLSAEFAGLAADPADPVSAIIGVGFEHNLALGVAEYLDVSSVYAFVPYGHDAQFDAAVDDANSSLFLGGTPCRRAQYNLTNPSELYVRLESLVYGLGRNNRVALVPLGPKIFCLVSLLVALNTESPVAVWRFSGGSQAARATDSDLTRATSSGWLRW